MKTALFLSPHLDDVAFSCGGLAASLADAGWRTVLVTAFTRSVLPATGFALACQLDKGLTAEVDYMALRRAEDLVAAERLGFDEVIWLDLPEAPHRGYQSAPALFADLHPEDGVVPALTACFRQLQVNYQPDLVLAPQGLGGHVDHRQVIAAVLAAVPLTHAAFYRDTPYAIRAPDAAADAAIPRDTTVRVPIAAALDRKISAAQAYTTQIGFQFQGPENTARALRDFAIAEGHGRPAERLAGLALPAFLAEAIAA
jgi:LmbE family N-acetylglucosaminyl deacetylase